MSEWQPVTLKQRVMWPVRRRLLEALFGRRASRFAPVEIEVSLHFKSSDAPPEIQVHGVTIELSEAS